MTPRSLWEKVFHAIPPVLGDEFDQVICGDLVALLLEEWGEAGFPVHIAMIVFEHRPRMGEKS